ncbi:hypothetical protein JCM3766R1_003038 [Sporobolomyces carnicolor]
MIPVVDISDLAPCHALERRILSDADIGQWKLSIPYTAALDFIHELVAVANDDDDLEHDDAATASTEPGPASSFEPLFLFVDRQQGRPVSEHDKKEAFTLFRAKLAQEVTQLHLEILPSLSRADAVIPEVSFHLVRAFGSLARLDYGTGHELSFLLYLVALRRISVLRDDDDDSKRIVDDVWPRYWRVTDRIRDTFELAIAGRRGVWKKKEREDADHPERVYFDQGASEARAHPSRSKSNTSLSNLNVSSSTTLHLLRSIFSRRRRRRGPSPSSSQVPSLSSSSSSSSSKPRPNSEFDELCDLIKLYDKTVLTSLPALLHLRFGSILPFYDVVVVSSSSEDGGHPEEQHGRLERRRRLGRGGGLTRIPATSTGMMSRDEQHSSSSEAEDDDEDDRLETLQNRRATLESTVAPWSVPTLSGRESDQQRAER